MWLGPAFPLSMLSYWSHWPWGHLGITKASRLTSSGSKKPHIYTVTVVHCTNVIFYVCPNAKRLGSHRLDYEMFLLLSDIKIGLTASFPLLSLWTRGKKKSSAVRPRLGWHRQSESIQKVLRCPLCHPHTLCMARAAQSQRWKLRLQVYREKGSCWGWIVK